MKNYMDKMTDKYIKDVKNILPFVRREEKEYLYNLELEIKGYIEAHRMTDFKYVIEKFGSPCDAAMDYIEHHIDEKTMIKMRKVLWFCLRLWLVHVFIKNVYMMRKINNNPCNCSDCMVS